LVVDHLKALIIFGAYACFQHAVSHSTRCKARNLPKTDPCIITSTRKQNGTSRVNQDRPGDMGPRHIGRLSCEIALACGVHFHCRATEEYLGGCMAKIIEFYIPQSFRKVSKWLAPNERGKVLEFPMVVRQSA
jgi:hypothetical protein